MRAFKYVRRFDEIGKDDISIVGGKGANLGELTQAGMDVPPGFCLTAQAYRDFISHAGLEDDIKAILQDLDLEDSEALAKAGGKIREKINAAAIFPELKQEIVDAYAEFSETLQMQDPQVAIRSSATAEDLPTASFAGMQETYLFIKGTDELLKHVKKSWASLWTARAIYYRNTQGFDQFAVALSSIVQKMVNSEKSGIMFTVNPVSGIRDEMIIDASWGLGEAVVSGAVSPDEYIVSKKDRAVIQKELANKKVMVVINDSGNGTHTEKVADYLGPEYPEKECLNDEDLTQLIEAGIRIEAHYGKPQDTEWGIDQDTKHLYILQSRPITTLKEQGAETEKESEQATETKRTVLVKGLAASPGIASGKVRKVNNKEELPLVQEGDILVAVMTDPDMIPAMKKCAGIVTDEGGRTCHAAIISRELQIPCIVGTGEATQVLEDGMEVTMDATRGVVYAGIVSEKEDKTVKATPATNQAAFALNDEIRKLLAPITATKIYMNLGDPEMIDKYKDLPFDGIGLMRTEFIFSAIGIHPMYLVKTGQGELLIEKLSEGILKAATAIYPRPIVVRMSDFRTNEFRGLEGGEEVEPTEQNPMIGWRGVSRYISEQYEEGFRLECRALRKVREEYGMDNVILMLPFVRMPEELIEVKKIMAEEGLKQTKSCKIWIMAEVPSVVMQIDEFAELVDGISIGSNDLTQLIMGADRDSGILSKMGYFDERNTAVMRAIQTIIEGTHRHGKTVSICGQAPSQYPEFAEFLVRCGIDSMSLNPDTVDYTRRIVASVEKKIMLDSRGS